jgi:aspartyl/asparaginyl-tRNA synthetase
MSRGSTLHDSRLPKCHASSIHLRGWVLEQRVLSYVCFLVARQGQWHQQNTLPASAEEKQRRA